MDPGRAAVGPPDPAAESGRGLHIIRACADRVELRAVRPHGLAVHMLKPLT